MATRLVGTRAALLTSFVTAVVCALTPISVVGDELGRDQPAWLQNEATRRGVASWGHWGANPKKYAGSADRTNRLIPVYTYGLGLDSIENEGSVYRSAEKLKSTYGVLPEATLNKTAEYFDQTQIYEFQQASIRNGKKYVVLLLIDGMDWHVHLATSIYQTRKLRALGTPPGLLFSEFKKGGYGFCVTSRIVTWRKRMSIRKKSKD